MKNLVCYLFIAIHALCFSQAKSEWSKQENLSGEIFDKAVAFRCNGNLFSCLGTDRTEFRRDLWKYSFKNNKWERAEDFPGEPRISAIAFSIGNKAYVGTGLSSSSNSRQGLNDFWGYDSEKNKWEQKASMPGGIRYGAVAFTINGKAYVALGANQSTYYNDLWEYDPETNQWTKKADFPDNGRSDASVFVINNEAYVSFGQTKELFISKKKSWKYSPVKNEWSPVAEFPDSPRAGVIVFSYENKGYAMGGTNGTFKRFEEFWEYDATKNKWKENIDVPYGSCAYGFAFVNKDTAFIYSGKTKNGSTGVELWKYNLAPSPKNLMIGGRLLVGEDRMPEEGIKINISTKNGEIIRTTKTNLYGTFLLSGLPDNQDLFLSLDVSDTTLKGETYRIINKHDQEVAILNSENNYRFYIYSPERDKQIATEINKRDLRMNLKGLLVWDNKRKSPLSNISISLFNDQEKVISEGTTDEKGNFLFKNIPVDSVIYLSIQKKNMKSTTADEKILLLADSGSLVSKTPSSYAIFEMTNLPPDKNILAEVYIEDAWLPQLINSSSETKLIEPIYFDLAKWDIVPYAKITLNKAVVLLKSNPKYSIDIAAHTDCRGDNESNQILSDKRANAVKEYFIGKVVSLTQIVVKGYGESQPINNCIDGVMCTEEEHAQNRRMEFKIRLK